MALTFPLSLNDFLFELKAAKINMELKRFQEVSGTRGGNMIAVDRAPPRWIVKIQTDILTARQSAKIDGLINALDGSMRLVYITDPQRMWPQNDYGGQIIGAYGGVIRIAEIHPSNKQIRFKNMPNNYTIGSGSFFSFDFGTNPVHRAFHQTVEPEQADGTGETGWIEIRPFLLPGAAVNDVVTFYRPSFLARLIPDSYDPGDREGIINPGMSMQFRQEI